MNFKNLTKQEIANIIELCHFTKKERQFFDYRCDGVTLSEIAEEMGVCERTADNLSRKIKDKIKKAL